MPSSYCLLGVAALGTGRGQGGGRVEKTVALDWAPHQS